MWLIQMRTTFLTKILLQDVMNESVIGTGGWFETVSEVPKLWLRPKLFTQSCYEPTPTYYTGVFMKHIRNDLN